MNARAVLALVGALRAALTDDEAHELITAAVVHDGLPLHLAAMAWREWSQMRAAETITLESA